MRRNFFIFLTKESNFRIAMRLLLYGANVSRNDQRSLGNVKPGDLAMIWVPEQKLLYGVFEIQNRIFYAETDLGWTKLWPYRCRLKLWDGYLRTIRDEKKAKLMSFVSRELITLNDLTNLGGFIHSLLYDEGAKLLNFFLENSEMQIPSSVFPDFGINAAPPRTPFDFAAKISPTMAEYNLEMYLLQHYRKLEELVGTDVSELYNMLFGYQRRYLDIMTVHRNENGKPFKTTIVELKVGRLNEERIKKALDELSSYMFWVSDQMRKGKMPGSPDSVFGILVSSRGDNTTRDLFRNNLKFFGNQYGIQVNKMHYISFDIKENELFFKLRA